VNGWLLHIPTNRPCGTLIAAPGIVALGYASRADTLKNIDRCVMPTASVKRLLKAAMLDTNMTFLTVLRRLAVGFGLSGTSRIMRNLPHNGLAAALIFLYSRNVLSSTVRAFISF